MTFIDFDVSMFLKVDIVLWNAKLKKKKIIINWFLNITSCHASVQMTTWEISTVW